MKSVHTVLDGHAKGGLDGAARSLRIAVFGASYVGLVTAACLARHGHRVVAVDIDAGRIERLNRAEIDVYETGLPELVQQQAQAGRLHFTTDANAALAGVDLVFVAVGTPVRRDGATEMRAVDDVARSVAAVVRAPAVLVLKSTVPVGTAARLRALLAEWCDEDEQPAHVLSNPEFLRQGSAIADFTAPERVLIGDDVPASNPARELLLAAYAPIVDAGVPVLTMDTCSAELSKQAANAMLATRISFINEMAAIAGATGADIENVREGIGSDRRIGRDFLQAGLGYGGSCFAKDVASLRDTARQHKLRSDLLLATERVNSRQRCWAFDALRRDTGSYDKVRSLRVAIWGLAFKPRTDDMRGAPSLQLIDRLVRAGASVTVYDPVAMDNARLALSSHRRIAWADSAEGALRDADALLLVTEWPEFVDFDPRRVARALRLRTVYDGRNALDVAGWEAAGMRVVQVGRPCGAAPARPLDAAFERGVADGVEPLPSVLRAAA